MYEAAEQRHCRRRGRRRQCSAACGGKPGRTCLRLGPDSSTLRPHHAPSCQFDTPSKNAERSRVPESDFSSGPVSDMRLKPGDRSRRLLSPLSVPGGWYIGATRRSPAMAPSCLNAFRRPALLLGERARKSRRRQDLIRRSTAIRRRSNASRLYSPRKQGASLVNVLVLRPRPMCRP